jgi:hypothetical protein
VITFTLGYVSDKGNYFKTPIPHFGFGAIFGVVPYFIVVETCSFGFPTGIPLGLAGFERNRVLDEISFGFKT